MVRGVRVMGVVMGDVMGCGMGDMMSCMMGCVMGCVMSCVMGYVMGHVTHPHGARRVSSHQILPPFASALLPIWPSPRTTGLRMTSRS